LLYWPRRRRDMLATSCSLPYHSACTYICGDGCTI
jgi:hypothetical protein